MFNKDRWKKLWKKLGGNPGCGDIYDSLLKAYSEPHRHYHTTEHITDCLHLFDDVRDMINSPLEFEMAIWLHDVVYKIFSKDNEKKSADYAEQVMRRGRISDTSINSVKELIMITDHNSTPVSNDDKFIVDIDLAILGQPKEKYDWYEAAVRAEYRIIPSFIYRSKRAELLSLFADRGYIYNTEYFIDKYEANARRNIEQAIKLLSA